MEETEFADGGDEVVAIDIAAVTQVNRAFYEAFEANDLDALLQTWERSDRVQCTHPGWSVLRGWSEVAGAWAALIDGPEEIQFVLTNEKVIVHGDVAWVTIDENMLGSSGSGTVSALNIFVRGDDGWKMIGHHGSSVMQR